jgi:hypothetical protein
MNIEHTANQRPPDSLKFFAVPAASRRVQGQQHSARRGSIRVMLTAC